MAIKVSAIVSTLKSLEEDELANDILWRLLIDGLSKQQKAAYEYIVKHGRVSSMDIANHLKKPQNHTDNILKILQGYGLIASEPARNENGLHLVWREAKL